MLFARVLQLLFVPTDTVCSRLVHSRGATECAHEERRADPARDEPTRSFVARLHTAVVYRPPRCG